MNSDWKTKVLVVGTAVGALIGLGTAYFLVRTSEENNGGPPEISTTDYLKAGLGVVGMVRAIAALGSR